MHRLGQFRFLARPLLVAAALFQFAACPTNNQPTSPVTPITNAVNTDRACPAMIPDQPTNLCPRLKNITLTCGGNGMLHTTVGGGSGKPIVLGAKLDDGSVFSAVLVVTNCQDGPREGVTLGVTYTGQVSTPPAAPPCISQSKAVFSQFQFGDPLNAGFEGLAKDKMFQTLDDQAIAAFTSTLGVTAPAMSRCSIWRQMP